MSVLPPPNTIIAIIIAQGNLIGANWLNKNNLMAIGKFHSSVAGGVVLTYLSAKHPPACPHQETRVHKTNTTAVS
jgi:hypothetical protein